MENKIQKAVILAGGKGSRLHPLTLEVPKPLITIRKRPLINYNLGMLAQYGVNDVVIIIRPEHRKDYERWAREYGSEFTDMGMSIRFVEEPEPMGTFGYLYHHLRDWMGGEEIFVSNGDEIKTIDLAMMERFHGAMGAPATIALVVEKERKDAGFVLVRENRVTEFLERQTALASDLMSAGLYIISPAVFLPDIFKYSAAHLPDGKKLLMFETDLFPALAKVGQLVGFVSAKGTVADCGTFERWERAITGKPAVTPQMQKVLVTGGAGYIGSILVPELLRAGHEVTVIDNFLYGQHSLLDVCNFKTLTIVRGDARDEALIKKHIIGKDFIIPLACIVGAPACDMDPVAARTINLEAIQMIMRLRAPDQKIIFPNTNSGYGKMQEGVAYCDETSPLEPVSLYGKLKVQAEQELLSAGNAITLRLATVFGASPRKRLDLLVNDFVYRAVTDRAVVLFEPHFKRNYIHVRDVASAFMHAMNHFDVMKDQAYNVGLSDANLSKSELCEEIKQQLPKFVFVESAIGEDPDKRNYIISNAKIEATGYQPRVSLREGIAELIKAYQVIRRNEFTNL